MDSRTTVYLALLICFPLPLLGVCHSCQENTEQSIVEWVSNYFVSDSAEIKATRDSFFANSNYDDDSYHPIMTGETICTVVSTRMNEIGVCYIDNVKYTCYEGIVDYSYNVDSQQHMNSDTVIAYVISQEFVYEVLNHYSEHSRHFCFYNIVNPHDSILESTFMMY